MDKKNYTRVAGTTRYIKMGDMVCDTIAKDAPALKTICECLWCGDRYGADASGKCKMYCKNCSTKEGRKKIREENEAIKNARLKLCNAH